MRRRGDVNAGTRSSASRGSARRNRALALAILALLGLATVAPAGQADGQSSSERAAQRAVQSAERTAQREAVRMQREAARNARKAAKADEQAQRTAEREAARLAALVTPHATVELQCRKIVVRYTGFNGLAGMPNVAVQHVIFRHRPGGPPTYLFPAETFSFEGSEATETIPIAAPLGTSGISMRSRFEGPSVKGGFHVRGPITCGPIPQYSLETLQSTGGALTSAPLAATVGQAVTYETLATNTGNTPLTFTGFSDPGCDSMLADGQPGAVAPHSSVTFLCSHSLTNADRTAGFFANAAGLTGTPGPGEGEPITSTSNGLLVAPIGAGAETPKPEASKEVTAAAAPAVVLAGGDPLAARPVALRAQHIHDQRQVDGRLERDVLHRRPQARAAHGAQRAQRHDLDQGQRSEAEGRDAQAERVDHDDGRLATEQSGGRDAHAQTAPLQRQAQLDGRSVARAKRATARAGETRRARVMLLAASWISLSAPRRSRSATSFARGSRRISPTPHRRTAARTRSTSGAGNGSAACTTPAGRRLRGRSSTAVAARA
jgi:hypothetical protein